MADDLLTQDTSPPPQTSLLTETTAPWWFKPFLYTSVAIALYWVVKKNAQKVTSSEGYRKFKRTARASLEAGARELRNPKRRRRRKK